MNVNIRMKSSAQWVDKIVRCVIQFHLSASNYAGPVIQSDVAGLNITTYYIHIHMYRYSLHPAAFDTLLSLHLSRSRVIKSELLRPLTPHYRYRSCRTWRKEFSVSEKRDVISRMLRRKGGRHTSSSFKILSCLSRFTTLGFAEGKE